MRISGIVLLLALCFFREAAFPERVSLTVLATTDLHGNIYPVDYFTSRSAPRGLAKIATLIREARAENPNTLLLDCGDTIQGTPLEYAYQTIVRTGHPPLNISLAGESLRQDPMMLAMNQLGYDAMVVGNHEFNFGLKNLQRAREDARFPWIAANIEAAPDGREKRFEPYLLKTVSGVKVAVIGITTPAVPTWEKPENFGAYRFLPGKQTVQKAVAALQRQDRPDLILVAAHAGLDRDLKTGALRTDSGSGENMIYELAAGVPEIEAVVFGHTHQELASYRIGNVLLTQPKNWGMSLARLDFVLESKPGGGWTVIEKSSRLIPVTKDTIADPGILRLAAPYHELAERYLSTEVAESPEALDGRLGRVEDTPLVDAVHVVQLYYAKADVSFTAMFNTRVKVPKGPVTVRQIAALYVYDNELYAIEGDGKMVKEALENAARYFISCQEEACAKPPLTNPRVLGFNYDMAQGVEYEIDLTKPEGNRIRNLKWKGRPLPLDQKLRIAVNNYRAAGSAGYSMFSGAKILWRSSDEIRDLIVRYFTEHRVLPARPDGNWQIIPAEARHTLEKQAMLEASRADAY